MPPIDVKELSAILQDKHDQTADRLRGDLEAYVDKSVKDHVARSATQVDQAIKDLEERRDSGGLSEDSMHAAIAEVNQQFRSEMQAIVDELDGKISQARIDAAENTGQLIKFQSATRGGGEVTPLVAGARAFVEQQRNIQSATRDEAQPYIRAMTKDAAEAHFDALRIKLGLPRLDPVLSSMLRRITHPEDGQTPIINPDGFIVSAGESNIPLSQRRLTAALTGEGATGGDNWTPILIDADMWVEMRLEQELVHPHIPAYPMGQRQIEKPSYDSDVYSDFLAPSGQDYGDSRDRTDTTTQVTSLTAHEFSQFRWVSGFFESDSVVNVADSLMMAMRQMAGEMYDAIILNSDPDASAASNVNGVAAASGVSRQGFASGITGVRAYLDATAAAQINKAAALGDSDINDLRAVMGQAGKRPGEQLIISPTSEYYALLDFDLYRRMDAYGLMAAAMQGEVREIYRMLILCPEQLPTAFNDDGRVDSTPANNTKGAIIAIAPRYWLLGIRMMPQMVVRDAYGTQPMGSTYGMVMRTAFAGVNPESIRANRQPAALMRNITRAA